MSELTWLPYDVVVWETRVRELHLSVFEEGALMRLVRGAILATDPCTIADTPDELARIVGAEWKKAVPVFRAHFSPLPDEPKKRRCGWLYDLYLKQLEKHRSYSGRGGEGARRKAELKAQRDAERTAQLEAQLEAQPDAEPKPSSPLSRAESSAEALSCAPTEHTAKSPASGDAPAPVGAARADADGEGFAEFGGAWRAAVQRDALAPPRTPSGPATQAADTHTATRERRYFALLASEAAAWMALHRADATAIEQEQRGLLQLPATGDLLLADRRALRDAVLEAIRDRLGWPTTEEWDESDSLTTPITTGALP